MVVREGALWMDSKEVKEELSTTVKVPKKSTRLQDNCRTRFLARPRNCPPLGIRKCLRSGHALIKVQGHTW